MSIQPKSYNRGKRILRIKKRISQNQIHPRIVVYRSNKHIYAQIINDKEHKTLLGISDTSLKGKEKLKPIELARELGKTLGEKAKEVNISNIVFDRRGYKYHGRVKALAEGIRESGLIF